MRAPAEVRRVVVVILDGLRADAIPLYQLPELAALAAGGCTTFQARTVSPSITVTALTSLMTGVGPRVHGMTSDRIALPRNARSLTALPRVLQAADVPTFVFRAALPWAFRAVGRQIGHGLAAELTCAGTNADEILDRALPSMAREAPGLWVCHWPDADLAGHAAGWTSAAYRRVLDRLDRAVGRLVRETGVDRDPGSVLVLLSDHGGGGSVARNHDSEHPLNTTIPLILAGGQVRQGELVPGTTLLDVPATIPWLFGLDTPATYEGRILREAFPTTATSGAFLGVAA